MAPRRDPNKNIILINLVSDLLPEVTHVTPTWAVYRDGGGGVFVLG